MGQRLSRAAAAVPFCFASCVPFLAQIMRNKTYILPTFVLGAFALFLPLSSYAADLGFSYGQYSGLTGVDLRFAIAMIIRFVLGLLGIVTLVMMLYAGYTWMISMGNQDAVAKAKKTIIRSAIGLGIILSAYAITNFVFNNVYPATFNNPYGSCPQGQCINGP